MDINIHDEFVNKLCATFREASDKLDDSVEPEVKNFCYVALALMCEFMRDGKRIADALEAQNSLTAAALRAQGVDV